MHYIIELSLHQLQKFFNSLSYFQGILLTFAIEFELFHDTHHKTSFAQLISEEVHRELVQLLIQNRDEVHYQLLEVQIIVELAYGQKSRLRENNQIDDFFPLFQGLLIFCDDEMDEAILKFCQKLLLLVFPFFREYSLQDGSFIHIDLGNQLGLSLQKPWNVAIIYSIRKFLKLSDVLLSIFGLCFFLYFDFDILIYILFILVFINIHILMLFLLLLFIILVFKAVELVDWIQLINSLFVDVLGILCPKTQVTLRIGSQVSIKVIVLHSCNIALGIFSFNLTKFKDVLVPLIDKYSLFITKNQKLGYFEHMVLGCQTIRDDVGSQRYHLYAFEFTTDFPAYVINAQLYARWGVQKQQYTQ